MREYPVYEEPMEPYLPPDDVPHRIISCLDPSYRCVADQQCYAQLIDMRRHCPGTKEKI